MDRRSFIKLTAVTGTTATLASCGSPENQLIRFVPDEDLTPGIAEIKTSACPLCGAGCGTTVRVMQGDVEIVRNGQPGVVTMSLAKKLEGNPTHPLNQGTLCARGQAAIQVTYHPDRLKQPMKLKGARGSGDFQAISWDDAIAELVGKLDMLADSGAQAALSCWTRRGGSARHDVLAAFAQRFGGPTPVLYDFFSDDVLRRANLLSFGRDQLPTFDLANARYVISFGADFLGTWNAPVAQTVSFGKMRQARPGVRGALVQVETRMSLTGGNADEWVAIRPGTEGVLALGLAHVILANKLRPADAAGRAGALIDGWAGGLADYAPDAVEKKTGVQAARIERLARELADQRPAVAIIGGASLAYTNGLFQALAVNALNALLGAVGQPGGLSFMPQASAGPLAVANPRPARAFRELVADINGAQTSPVQALLIDGVNPVFASPAEWNVRDAILKVPFVVSFGSFIDDTSTLADLILPDSSFLEAYVESRPETGGTVALATVAGPAMKPLYQTRSTPDVLLDVARKLKQPLKPELPETFDKVLQAQIGDDNWSNATKQGWIELKAEAPKPEAGSPKADARKATDATFDGDPAQYPFYFQPYASQNFYDGRVAHLPWLQEMPDPLVAAMWSSWIEINPKTAQRLGIADADIVEVTSAHGKLRAPAVLSPGVAPDALAMPVGQGHEKFTRYASGRGANPIKVLATSVEPETGALAWASTRVRVARVGDADGSLVMFGASLTEHPEQGR